MWRSYTADTLGLGLTWGPSVKGLSDGVNEQERSAPVTTGEHRFVRQFEVLHRLCSRADIIEFRVLLH